MRLRRGRSDEGSHYAHKHPRRMLILRQRTAARSGLRMTGRRNGAKGSGVGTVDLREGPVTMHPLMFLDANCKLGMRARREAEEPWRMPDLLADLAYYEIQAALVYHAAAVDYSPDWGNRQLIAQIHGQTRSIPQWIVMPHHTFEMAPPDELVAEMLSLNVRSARWLPRSHGYGASEEIGGPLLSALEAHAIPLFVDVGELGISEAVALCRRHPALPLVVCGVGWSQDRLVNALLGTVPNLYLDTWAFQGHRAYERFVDRFGSQRLLFSTGLPEHCPGAARMMAVYEQLDEQARANIAGTNLLRLLCAVRGAQGDLPRLAPYSSEPAALGPEPGAAPELGRDPIVLRVRAGEPLTDELVIDAHAHIGHPGCMGVWEWAIASNDVDGLVGTMDRLGIDIACPSTWSGITTGDEAANEVALAAARKYPGRILPYACANPSYPDTIASELARMFATGLVSGFKPYPKWHHVPLTDPRNRPLLALCDRQRRPVLCHMYFTERDSVTPDQVDHLAPQYPGASFLCAHSGQSWEMARAVVGVVRRHPNVYAEITYPCPLYGMVAYLAREAGADRVLFGTDCVMQDAAPQLGWVAWARLPLEAKRLILGRNMARILGLGGERSGRGEHSRRRV